MDSAEMLWPLYTLWKLVHVTNRPGKDAEKDAADEPGKRCDQQADDEISREMRLLTMGTQEDNQKHRTNLRIEEPGQQIEHQEKYCQHPP